MAGIPFEQTVRGARFYDSTMPTIAKALESLSENDAPKIADSLERIAVALETLAKQSETREEAPKAPEKQEKDVQDKKNMQEVEIYASPYANCYGKILVPKGVQDLKGYVMEHFNDIDFNEPDLDFCGIDIELMSINDLD